jgi:serine/threonine protein kinase
MVIEFLIESFIQNESNKFLYREGEKLGEGSYGQFFNVNYLINNKFNAIKKIKFKNENDNEI